MIHGGTREYKNKQLAQSIVNTCSKKIDHPLHSLIPLHGQQVLHLYTALHKAAKWLPYGESNLFA